jgi:hypothetical protein
MLGQTKAMKKKQPAQIISFTATVPDSDQLIIVTIPRKIANKIPKILSLIVF